MAHGNAERAKGLASLVAVGRLARSEQPLELVSGPESFGGQRLAWREEVAAAPQAHKIRAADRSNGTHGDRMQQPSERIEFAVSIGAV